MVVIVLLIQSIWIPSTEQHENPETGASENINAGQLLRKNFILFIKNTF